MSNRTKEIESGKILIKKVFDKDMWYRIPEYQRPYVWSDDQIDTLLDDLSYAVENTPESQYFLGSIVLHSKEVDQEGIKFIENDLLDGQQRLTTLYLILAVIRDLTTNKTRQQTCTESIYQEANADDNIPERMRIVFDIREEVQEFVNEYVKKAGGTAKEAELKNEAKESEDVSVRNMAKAILKIRTWFQNEENTNIDKLFPFLRNYVLLIYVSSHDLEDSFRLFTILNDRGVKLRNSDILKAENLKAIKDPTKRKKYAKFWEELEGELDEDFDKFLSYVRTILVKDKARLSLLKEFEDNIYHPKEYKIETKKYIDKPALLNKGEDTFKLIEKYKKHNDKIFGGDNYSAKTEWAFDNLITILNDTALSDIWVAPLLFYFESFGDTKILEFLIKLDNKFSGDWIARETPTYRIDSMNAILKKIEQVSKSGNTTDEKINELLSSTEFDFNYKEFVLQLEENTIYGRRYARYILYKLDYLYGSKSEKKSSLTKISVEHILPQNPHEDSDWFDNFTEEEMAEWVHKLGNLVLISRKKNTSQGRLEYGEKKRKYFTNNIETFPNSLRILQNNNVWDSGALKANHDKVIKDLKKHYNIH